MFRFYRCMKCRRGLAMRIPSVRLSVRPSVKRVDCWWGRPLLPEILGQPAPVGAKSLILNRLSLVAPQSYDLAKKVQLTLIGSPLCAFQ